MCSVLCTGRKLLAHSRNCKLGAHHTHQYPHPLLELQGHTRNHMCLVVYAGLLRHMLKLPASQSCNLLIHRTGRYPDIRLELQGHTQIHKCLPSWKGSRRYLMVLSRPSRPIHNTLMSCSAMPTAHLYNLVTSLICLFWMRQTCSTLTKSLRQTDKLYIRWHID
ncbi:uncharacterized protein [Dermacentor albipictus]|uniref:uncharacterized protein isoform X1 n=1 Tax=Dermacentor albipictus TaxID=60249 RepID=UPI0038FC4697